MLRVPASFNSKLVHRNEQGEIINIPESAEVKIIQNWNGVRPGIKPLLSDFYICLVDSKLKEIHRNRKSEKYSVRHENHKIQWIETLLQIPIADHRKYALWRIVAPYLINVRKLSNEDVLSIISVWLDKCNKLKPLVRVNDRIKPNLNAAAKGYLPISFSHLKTENKELSDLISCQMENGISIL